eukprot:COSAG01_NODE_42673_length_437_cov_3.020710_1_plen_20_part_01
MPSPCPDLDIELNEERFLAL